MEDLLWAQGFKYECDLGAGTYGHVVKCTDLGTGRIVAVKLRDLRGVKNGKSEALEREFSREFHILTSMKHDNIVQVYRFKTSPLMIVMEWMPSGSLRSVKNEVQFRLREQDLRQYTRGALRGLAHLHKEGVLHRDVKPGNMLVKDGTVKLSDFGAARRTSNRREPLPYASHDVGTPAYLAPEVITKARHSKASDIWALACSVVDLGSTELLWSELGWMAVKEPMTLMFHIGHTKQHPRIPDHFSTPLQQILERCFEQDYKMRPTAAQLLTDPYFTAPTLPPDAETFEAYKLARKAAEQCVCKVSANEIDTDSSQCFCTNTATSPTSSIDAIDGCDGCGCEKKQQQESECRARHLPGARSGPDPPMQISVWIDHPTLRSTQSKNSCDARRFWAIR